MVVDYTENCVSFNLYRHGVLLSTVLENYLCFMNYLKNCCLIIVVVGDVDDETHVSCIFLMFITPGM